MIKRQYSGNERRARNYIWNAAGRYDFEPSFLAFSPDGSPDMYYNLVIGLAYKWLDMEAIQEFIKRYSASRSAEEFDDLFWLGLENCVYEKEIGERPVLEKLRREKAEAWFKSAADMSRQQMEMQSMTVYEQQMIRWSKVLGRFCHAGGRSLALAGRLLFSGDPIQDGNIFMFGDQREIHAYILLFPDSKKLEITARQRDYWKGLHKNEFVVCLGLQGRKVAWCNTLSWMDAPTLDLAVKDYFHHHKEDIYLPSFIQWLRDNLYLWKRKEFHDFKYLGRKMSLGETILYWAVTLSLTVVTAAVCIAIGK